MSPSRVVVERDGLRRHAMDADGCPYVFADARRSGGTDEALESLARAVDDANEDARRLLRTIDGHSPAGDRPHWLPQGPSGVVASDDPDLTLRWFELLAEHLDGDGWSGKLTPLPRQPDEASRPESYPVSAVLALSGWHQLRPGGVAWPVWRSAADIAGDLAALATSWVQAIDGQDWFATVGPDALVPASELRTTLHRALADHDERAFMRAGRTSDTQSRTARFTSRGHLMLESVDDRPVSTRVAEIAQVVLPWATRCDYVYVAGADPLPEQQRSERGRDDSLPEYYIGFRHLDDGYLPDAFVTQVVTTRHLARAHDLSQWRITEIAPERHRVDHPEREAWFVPDPSAGSTRPDPGVLARARADFGDLILTEG